MAQTGNAKLAQASTEVGIMATDHTRATRVDRPPTADEWERMRPIFKYYYKDLKKGRGLPLPQVRRIMADEYGFFAR